MYTLFEGKMEALPNYRVPLLGTPKRKKSSHILALSDDLT
jgi:hypothetical protein